MTEDLRELATVETYPKLDGRNMVMVLAPLKRPTPRPAADERRADLAQDEGSVPQPEPAGEAQAGEGEGAASEPQPEPAGVGEGKRKA